MIGKRLLASLDGAGPAGLWLLSLGLTLVLGAIDYLTGPEIAFSVFYLVPVSCAAYFLGRRPGLAIAVLSAIVWLAADVADGPQLSSPLIHYWNAFTRLVFFGLMTVVLTAWRGAYEQQRALARADFLTGVANSRAFFETAELELERARRFKRPVSLIYMDVDGFKGVNDTRGHKAGDDLLVAIATALRAAVRKTDFVARLGGDEFVVILPEAGEQDALAAAEKLQARLRETMREAGWPVSFSMGLATADRAPPDVESLVREADALAYEAKRAGKDRIQQRLMGSGPAASAPMPTG